MKQRSVMAQFHFLAGTARRLLRGCCVLLLASAALPLPGQAATTTWQDKVAARVQAQAALEQPVEALVLLDDSTERAAQQKAAPRPWYRQAKPEYVQRLGDWKRRLDLLKAGIEQDVADPDTEVLHDYAVLPVLHVRVRSQRALERLAGNAKVLAVDENKRNEAYLTESLPLIHQPEAWADGAGYGGAGSSVAVLDTGVDYTRAAFGTCSAPGAPAESCRVSYAHDFAPSDGVLDDDGHGTNVAGIVLGVAPVANILALDVFRTDGYAYDSDILSAINWCVTNKATYHIAAINMSLGSGRYYSPVSPSDAWGTAIQSAVDAGIVVVAAAGNDGYTNSLGMPAAYANVVSVGAVYDSALGAMHWGICSDATTAADKVTCWSDSAPFLTMLAPGSIIDAADVSMSGTSQATPHVAGAAAVLRSVFPADSADQLAVRLQQGQAVTDPRNSLVKPRLDLTTALATADKAILVSHASPAEGGSVSPASGVYQPGASVTLSAVPNSGYAFAGWSGDCGGSDPQCILSMAANKTVSASFVAASTALTNGQSVTNLAGASASSAYFYIDVPSGATGLTVTISGGTGDADLYVRAGSLPTTTAYDCRPWLTGNAETCTFSNPVAGRYYIMLYGYASYSGVTLKAAYAVGSGQTLQFGAPSYSVTEGTSKITIPVLREGGTTGSVSVKYATANGTALAGKDYTAKSGTLSFAAGVSKQSIAISISNDSQYEATESFLVNLSSPVGAALGSNASTEVSILDNDKNLAFESATASVSEGDGAIVLTVLRLGDANASASVSFATASGTARSGIDFKAVSGKLYWAAGDATPKTITVPVIDDALQESSETFKVSLSSARGATLAANKTVTVTILDND
ncbi:Calx-beta domain-containing protein [Parasulfuritortus cantonensis]|nr:Calx-beta domain-containing protein [Parasulfuritortus cantonensis]